MIQEEVIRNLENTKRSALAMNGIYLLKYAEVPGALVEIGFLSNEVEREQLKTDAYQRKMAASIYEGILRYITEEPKERNERKLQQHATMFHMGPCYDSYHLDFILNMDE